MRQQKIYRQIYQENYHAILRFCRHRVNSLEDAEDLCEECFLIAWRKLGDTNPDSLSLSLKWLYQVARNLIGDYYRRNTREQLLLEELGVGKESPPESSASELVLETLLGLAENEREILYLSYWEGLSAREVGVYLACSEQAAWKRISRAKIAFKNGYLNLLSAIYHLENSA